MLASGSESIGNCASLDPSAAELGADSLTRLNAETLCRLNAEVERNYGQRGLNILQERYTRRGETPAEAMWRVCRCVASGCATQEADQAALALAHKYMDKLLLPNRFLPNTPTWTGAGVGKGQLAACFVLPIEDNMESIFGTLRDAALIQSTGGGTGFTFGHLRPAGSTVNSSQGITSGPISFIGAYDAVFTTVQQGGTRRGANMAMMPVSHPDIYSFIKCKQVEGKITNFNLSVSAPDAFMRAVEKGSDWELRCPVSGEIKGIVRASALFDEIAEGGKRNGEPGIVFIDAVNRDNPCPDLFSIEATNPCVPGDTVVNTSHGPQYVRDLIGVDFETPDGIAVPKGFFRTKTVTELLGVTTELGFSILCTPEHRLMTTSGWKTAESLESIVSGSRDPDKLIIKAGTYKTPDARADEFPSSAWAKRMAPLFAGGASNREFAADDSAGFTDTRDSAIEIIEQSSYKGAICLIRELWTAAGRPKGKLSFIEPRDLKLVRAFQLALLRLGIVCAIDSAPLYEGAEGTAQPAAEAEIELELVPTADCAYAFTELVTALTDEMAFIMVWHKLHIREITDRVSDLSRVAARGKGRSEDVYDATCDPAANKPVLWTGAFLSHNCSEVPLSNYESCCLGSINLRSHVKSGQTLSLKDKIDWNMLEETVHTGADFLSHVIMANKFVPAVPQLMQKARDTMRIGLGIMGLADLFFGLGVRYGSPESISIASQVMEFVRYHAMLASMRLAVAHGPFPAYKHSTYLRREWQVPTPLDAKNLFGIEVPDVDIGRPLNMNWAWLQDCIAIAGLRNITTTAVAPTGTLSLVAGVSGFGCEPVFALSHRRRILGLDGVARYEHMLVPELAAAMDASPELAADPEKKARVMAEILRTGTCSNVPEVPEDIARVFACASDISVKEHVMMQAALQRFVDGAISKTINLPPGSGKEDVKNALTLAWRSGCKGICVYVAGSRQVEVLTAGAK